MENAGAGVKAACRVPSPGRRGEAMSRIDDERENRLAAALRDNLRRRKAQARAADAPDSAAARPTDPDPVTPSSKS